MDVIVDANELFSIIIAKGKKRQTKKLDIFFSDKLNFFVPYRLLAELEKHREEIRLKSGFSHEDFDVFVEVVKLRIKPVPLEEFLDKISEAKPISKHAKDIEFFALALAKKASIWSEEKSFKEQDKVEVFNTEGLYEKLLSKTTNSL